MFALHDDKAFPHSSSSSAFNRGSDPNILRFLNFEEALIQCERDAVLGMLEDVHRLKAGMPSAGTTLTLGGKPFLPYAASFKARAVGA